jgi:ubiquinone/menaquinone biosynthesis C-methylase UbiE
VSVVDNKLLRVKRGVIRRRYIEEMAVRLKPLKPRRVLEVGCGQGVNIEGLSSLLPEANFVGLEPTLSGVEAARLLLGGHASVIRGNGVWLPFHDKSFDCGLTCLVLEQLPRQWKLLVSELHRVVKSHCLFLEPFWEAQNRVSQKWHLYRRDYFRERYSAIEQLGFQVVEFYRLPTYHNPRFGVGICVAQVNNE